MYRILVVDAEESFHAWCRRLISQINAEAVILEEAYRPADARAKLRCMPLEMIIADIVQPGVAGLIEQIRAQSRHRPELLVVSAVCDAEYMRRAIQWQALDYLTKPVRGEEMAALLQGRIEARRQEARRTEVEQQPLVQAIHGMIEANGTHMYSVRELADQFGVTPNYLSYLFKKKTGTTFSAYQCEIKMEQARRLLADQPQMRVYEIASMLGYADEKYFSRVFGRFHRMTPSQYRVRMESESAWAL